MKRLRCLGWLLPLFLIVVACNKTDRYNNIFVKGQNWKIFDDGVELNTELVTSCIVVDQSGVQGEDEYGTAIWRHSDGSEQEITWRFWRKATTFEFWHQGELDEASRASLQSYYRSGLYDVTSLAKKEFTIESEKTIGYEGKMIGMTLMRK